MKRIERRLDVTGAGDLGGLIELAVTVHLPDDDALGQPPPIIVAAPGAGYGRDYFDMHFAGREGYSQAAYHTQRGLVFVAVDLVGAGDSTIPDLARLDLPTLGRFHDAGARAIRRMAREGTLAPSLAPSPCPFLAGVGQSLGGAVSLVAQGRHASFDAVAVLGFSAIEVVLPQADGTASLREPDVAGYDLRYAFHWDDEPEEIVAADFGGGHPHRVTVPPFGSATMPGCVMTVATPGIVAADAALIEAPVFLANGERDMCANPRAEAAAYSASPDVTTMIVPRMAHMHNFAGTRHLLWQRLHDWIAALAAIPPQMKNF